MRRAILAVAASASVLLLTAPGAGATADRAEYAAQANQVCAAGNAEAERLGTALQRKVNSIYRRMEKRPFSPKKWDRWTTRIDTLFRRYQRAYLELATRSLETLAQIPAAPGDEQLVAGWIAVRRESIQVYSRLGGGFQVVVADNVTKRTKKARRRAKRRAAEEKRLYRRYLELYELDVEYASTLGAAYCVTGATGGP
jgi:hypothetical protein